MRRVEPGLWQKSRIEFEKESRNFLAHMHPAAHCDLIVCWKHNWKECPVEVLELSKLVSINGSPQICADLEQKPTTETQRHGEKNLKS
jgi:hypothetical protein